jgi:tRNA(Ile)-lysidine synthase
VVGHVNHGSRGTESDRDQAFVRRLCESLGVELVVHCARLAPTEPAFEERSRKVRREFFRRLRDETGSGVVVTGHTADDQVETVLMRIFEGAGIAGLKGIPRATDDGIVRPILDLWKEDIAAELALGRIPYRRDRSNRDTRFERNWVRQVLIPLLEKRYGKSVKQRIFKLGERFRELDAYLEIQARRWIRRNARGSTGRAPDGIAQELTFGRAAYAGLPVALRVKILQRLCFERAGSAPNERLLGTADRMLCSGAASARTKIGKGWEFVNRYANARLAPGRRPVPAREGTLAIEHAGTVTPARARRIASAGDAEVFDGSGLRLPLTVRAVRPGDRIRPFGLDAEKKVKELFIDRKVPREQRWGRPAVCDSRGDILWIPGVVRSSLAPVTSATRRAKIIRYLPTT